MYVGEWLTNGGLIGGSMTEFKSIDSAERWAKARLEWYMPPGKDGVLRVWKKELGLGEPVVEQWYGRALDGLVLPIARPVDTTGNISPTQKEGGGK